PEPATRQLGQAPQTAESVGTSSPKSDLQLEYYTDADEFGSTSLGDAPATIETVSWAVTAASVGVSVAATFDHGC
ncbi:hypothetical protein ACIPLC_37530, partial [Kitasatospora sp. NPDC086801]|uniref:hypothetical protein n=1 Tax=Kitasatospora sp. NPDC086801 TaxID=3364066 RepID=UPI0038255F16